MSVEAIDKRLKVYFGFSRMSHSVLDIGHPAVGALLILGAFPPFLIMLIGFIAAFAGFTAVFALNDLMDYKVDTERIERYQRTFSNFDIDVLGVRHPIAQKMLTFPRGLAWVLFLGYSFAIGSLRSEPALLPHPRRGRHHRDNLLCPPQGYPLEGSFVRSNGGDRCVGGRLRRGQGTFLGLSWSCFFSGPSAGSSAQGIFRTIGRTSKRTSIWG